MGKFSDAVAAVSLGASLAFNGASLPAAEPGQEPVPASSKADTVKSPQVHIWTRDTVIQELGGLKTCIEAIDLHFSTHPESAALKPDWEKKREQISQNIKLNEKLLEGNNNPEQLSLIGGNFQSVKAGLMLFQNSLDSQDWRSQNSNNQPQIMGIYNYADFEGMKAAATLSMPILNRMEEGPNKERIKKGFQEIQNSKDPGDLSRRLTPLLGEFMTSIGDLRGIIRNPREKNSVDKLEKLLEQNQSTSNQEHAWYKSFQTLLDRDKTPRLNPQGKQGYLDRTFKELLSTETGFKQVQESARLYKEELSKLPLPQLSTDKTERLYLAKSLEKIKTAENSSELPPDTLSTMTNVMKILSK